MGKEKGGNRQPCESIVPIPKGYLSFFLSLSPPSLSRFFLEKKNGVYLFIRIRELISGIKIK